MRRTGEKTQPRAGVAAGVRAPVLPPQGQLPGVLREAVIAAEARRIQGRREAAAKLLHRKASRRPATLGSCRCVLPAASLLPNSRCHSPPTAVAHATQKPPGERGTGRWSPNVNKYFFPAMNAALLHTPNVVHTHKCAAVAITNALWFKRKWARTREASVRGTVEFDVSHAAAPPGRRAST